MRLLFYIHDQWVFGKIHCEMIKALYPEIYCDIMSWDGVLRPDVLDLLLKKYDYLVTNMGAWEGLERLKIPWERVIMGSHGEAALSILPVADRLDVYQKLAGHFVISPYLAEIASMARAGIPPKCLTLGLFTDNYPRNTAHAPSTLGYFAKFKLTLKEGVDIKRGVLVKKMAEEACINLKQEEDLPFLAAETLYSGVHLQAFASLTEGNPYAMLEAFACGIPVLGTPTGLALEYLHDKGGVLLPFDEDDYVKEGAEAIRELKASPKLYRGLCDEAYEIGRTLDWKHKRDAWINYFNSFPRHVRNFSGR